MENSNANLSFYFDFNIRLFSVYPAVDGKVLNSVVDHLQMSDGVCSLTSILENISPMYPELNVWVIESIAKKNTHWVSLRLEGQFLSVFIFR